MEDIKSALLFFSHSLRSLIVVFGFHIFYFFIIVGLTIPVFFVSYTLTSDLVIFAVYVLLILPIGFFLRRLFFLRHQLRINIGFIHFLDQLTGADSIEEESEKAVSKKIYDKLPKNATGAVMSLKREVKKEGLRHISYKLLLALTSLRILADNGVGEEAGAVPVHPMPTGELLRKLNRRSMILTFLEFLSFLVFSLPFCLISYLFTLGLTIPIQVLVYLLGLMFAWFLNSVIASPFAALVVQKHALIN
ncbi:MAG: hypothetical protein GY765_32325 [bacterium]|nr:hypothetical protein [bacterium]